MKLFKTKKVKKPPTPISRREALSVVPVKNREVEEHWITEDEVLLDYPLRLKPLFASLLKRFAPADQPAPRKKLQLDLLGSSVWKLISGHRSVKQIIDRFATLHQLQPGEAEQSVTQFLRELGRRGLIGMR